MPSKMGSFRQKPVIVAILVENPRRKRFSSSNNHRHHHHLHQYHVSIHHLSSGGGYNRRAQLLEYSRRLRTSARSDEPRSLQPVTPTPRNSQQHNTQIVAVKRKPKHTTTPTCLGNWKILIPSFLKPMMLSQNKEKKRKKNNHSSTTTKMKAIVKSFQVHRKAGLFHKSFASLRKRR